MRKRKKPLTEGQILQRARQHARDVGHTLTEWCAKCFNRWTRRAKGRV